MGSVVHFDHPRPGEEVDWLAVDRNGRVGLFSSAGYGPVPVSVAAQLDRVERAVGKVNSLAVVGTAVDVPANDSNYSFWIDPARRGIFGYDWGPVASEPYARIATPSRPIVIDEIAERDVAVAALLVRLPLDFEASPQIGVADRQVPLFGEATERRFGSPREKYFERRQIKEAIAFAEEGG